MICPIIWYKKFAGVSTEKGKPFGVFQEKNKERASMSVSRVVLSQIKLGAPGKTEMSTEVIQYLLRPKTLTSLRVHINFFVSV